MDALKRADHFSRDDFDRRDAAEWAHRNRETEALTTGQGPKQTYFSSRLSELNHPMHQCSLLTLLSGGRIGGRRQRGEAVVERRAQRHMDCRGRLSALDQRYALRKDGKTPLGLVRRTLEEDALYLAVVNMPSEEELEACSNLDKKLAAHGQ